MWRKFGRELGRLALYCGMWRIGENFRIIENSKIRARPWYEWWGRLLGRGFVETRSPRGSGQFKRRRLDCGSWSMNGTESERCARWARRRMNDSSMGREVPVEAEDEEKQLVHSTGVGFCDGDMSAKRKRKKPAKKEVQRFGNYHHYYGYRVSCYHVCFGSQFDPSCQGAVRN